jgi:hypothetical protein
MSFLCITITFAFITFALALHYLCITFACLVPLCPPPLLTEDELRLARYRTVLWHRSPWSPPLANVRLRIALSKARTCMNQRGTRGLWGSGVRCFASFS